MTDDGRDLQGRPVFSHGLGVGDGRTRALEELRRSGHFAEALPDDGPLRDFPRDPDVVAPERGYGGDRILGRREPAYLAAHRAEFAGYADQVVSRPPPMGGMNRHSAPGDPEVFSTTPKECAEGVQIYGEAPRLSDTVGALQAQSARMARRQEAFERRVDAQMAGIEVLLAGISKKLSARPAAPRRKAPSRDKTKAKGSAR